MNQSQLNTPIVLIVYKRPDKTEKVFEAIRQVKPPKLFVIADGPRADRPGEAEKCAAARAVVNRVDWDCEILTNYSDINLGCRQRVSSGLNWVFDAVEEAIILEDDCLPHPTFFRFCEELLRTYRQEERIMVVSGDNFQFGRKRTDYSYYFSRYPHCWGWATWRRAWQHYDSEMKLWPQVRETNWLGEVLENTLAVQYWSKIFQKVYDGFNSWAYIWTFSCWINNGYSILPHVNLVSNIGVDRDATHTKKLDKVANLPVDAIIFPIHHPPVIMRDTEADRFTESSIFSGSYYQAVPRQTMPSIVREAIAQLNAKNNLEALTLLENAIATAPNLPSLNYGKAVALARLGRTSEAIATLNHLLATVPNHPKARRLLAEIQAPESVSELIAQARNHLETDRIEPAFHLLAKAKSLKQPTFGLDYLRAICFLKLAQLDAAKEALKEELRYFPHHTEAQTLQVRILSQTPQIQKSQIDDPEFQELLQAVRPYTMLSEARLYSLFSLTKQICQQNIPGNIVECGVAGGGSTGLMAAVIKRYSKQPRWLYAFDSFTGMPTPTDRDKHNGIPAAATGWGTGTCAAPEASVREICDRLGVSPLVKPVKGYFQETLPKMRNTVGTIALLHVDGDWYESTQTILQNLYDRVVSEGVLQVDDYGYWEGCRQAVREFETQRQLKFEIKPIDDTGVWFKKPDKFPVNPILDPLLVREFSQSDPVGYGIQSQMSPNERFQLYYTLRNLLPKTPSKLRFIEIGSYAGASLFLTWKTLNQIERPFAGFAVEPGGHPQFYEVFKQVADRVTHLRLFSHQAVVRLKEICSGDGNQPAFIFVDGDHTYKGVRQDIIDYFPLLAPGGIMMFHDYLPPLNEKNRDAILFHHGGNEPGIRQACQELMEKTYGCEPLEIPLLYPSDPTQTQAHLPIIPGVYSTIRAYRKPLTSPTP